VPVHGLFPALGPGDIGPPPACALPDAVKALLLAAGDVAVQLLDPETQCYTYRMGRVDPDLLPANVAAGNCSVDEMLHGVAADNIAGNFLGHLVYEPDAELLDPLDGAQIALVEAASPTLVISTDFFGNDILWGVALSDVVDPALARPEAEILAGIDETVDRLAATGAEVFLGNLPMVSLLPATKQKVDASLAAGLESGEVAARVQALDDLAATANGRLAQAAGRHGNVHVVDLEGWSRRIADEGLDVGGQSLGIRKFGGLVGLDGIHFTDTGYAVMANVFLEAIDAVLGTQTPRVDLEAVLVTDPESPAALAAAGVGSGCAVAGDAGVR